MCLPYQKYSMNGSYYQTKKHLPKDRWGMNQGL